MKDTCMDSKMDANDINTQKSQQEAQESYSASLVSLSQDSDGAKELIDMQALVAEGLPDEELLYDLADLFKVFSDTTRIKILFALINGDKNVSDIAEMINATQSAVSHQLRILKQARLVRFTRQGKNVHYSLADDHVLTVLAQGMSHICE